MSIHEHDTAHSHPNRPHSIDLTIELERELDSESLLNSPDYSKSQSRPQSLDPHVLASIVTQLRFSLAEVTKERDDFSASLAEARSTESSLKEALYNVSEKAVRLEGELAIVVDKEKDDADAVAMLRGKLEDSRRAIMRLTTESRRMSQASNLTLDLSRAGQPLFTGPSSSRRTSFTPLTGSPAARVNAHRRISSVSEPGVLSAPNFGDYSNWPPNSPRSSLYDPSAIVIPSSNAPSRRLSGFFGRAAPPPLDLSPTADASEIEELRKELQAIKEQLEETRHELTECQEAREASETCVNALRTFIADNSVGMESRATGGGSSRGTSSNIDDNVEKGARTPNSSRWGFKLWKSDSSTSATTPVSSPALPSANVSVPPSTGPPSKLGGFFSPRASISSTGSNPSPPQPHSRQQEPMFNGSDSSSIDDLPTEPVSPVSEIPHINVMVRVDEEFSSLSPSESFVLPSQLKGQSPSISLQTTTISSV